MENRTLLLRYIGDTPKLRIIDFFLDNRESDYSKKEIIEYTGISKTTLYKIWGEILEFGYLKATRRYGRAQLYALDQDNELIRRFKDLDDELGRQAMKNASSHALGLEAIYERAGHVENAPRDHAPVFTKFVAKTKQAENTLMDPISAQ